MKTMGFINIHKENENRIALLPCHMNDLGKEAAYLFFERGYASKLGIPDQEYEKMGASISTREEILQKCDIICDLKAGDAEYLGELREGTTIFGWVHPHVDPDMKKLLLDRKLRVYAWEEMLENSTQIFYRNSILAGEASVLHGCLSYGILMEGKRAIILGQGNTVMGTYKMLVSNAVLTTVYGRRKEQRFRKEMQQDHYGGNCDSSDSSPDCYFVGYCGQKGGHYHICRYYCRRVYSEDQAEVFRLVFLRNRKCSFVLLLAWR